jgi:hypothetical protein
VAKATKRIVQKEVLTKVDVEDGCTLELSEDETNFLRFVMGSLYRDKLPTNWSAAAMNLSEVLNGVATKRVHGYVTVQVCHYH